MSVYTKLNRARMALAKRKLEKTGFNKFAGYKYFDLGDFLQPVQEIFDDIGLCGVVSFSESIATLTITDTEDNAQIVITSPMGSAALKGVHEVQNIGAVETYQRRYLWVAALEIVEHDALDATTGSQEGDARAPHGYSAKGLPKADATPHKPTDGAMEGLDEETQAYLQTLYLKIVRKRDAEGIDAVCDLLEHEALETDAKVALWSLLDSKTRAAIKKAQEQRHANQTAQPPMTHREMKRGPAVEASA